jgi:hypothetical protein
MDFAFEKGGPITKSFVGKLPFANTDNVLVDVRVHSLQAGYYPAIPGWHLDWLPRTKGGEHPVVETIPDYDHVVLIVAETSLTEFVVDPVTMAMTKKNAFEGCNKELNFLIDTGMLKTEHVVSGDMVKFTSRDWHRPSPATKPEWRYLARASRVNHKKPSNRVVTQSQVYIPIREASW